MNKSIHLSFYQVNLVINSDSISILDRLKNDFSYFISQGELKPHFEVNVYLQSIPKEIIPTLKASSQSLNSITYDDGDIRYNDYYGEALSIYDYKNDKAEIYSPNLNRLHEITYLLILSRSGEVLDKKGFHKIHASGVSYQNRAFIMMMPMKGGKSTTFLNLLEQPEFEIISDDTPLISGDGEIFSFPLRVGIHKVPKRLVLDKKYISEIKRKLYGDKFLISMQAFKNPISKPCNKIVLFNGIRYSGKDTKIVRCSKISMIRPLMVHMVIGLGLPIILEYFLRFSFWDFLSKTKIFFNRLRSAFFLIIRADTYHLELGKDPDMAAKELLRFINEYSPKK